MLALSTLMLASFLPAQGGAASLLVDIDPDSSSSPAMIARVGALAFFHAADGTGRYLYSTDGTSAGTTRLDAQLGSEAVPFDVAGVPFAGLLYLTWSGGLAVSDGTQAGTRYVVQPAVNGLEGARNLARVGDSLLFLAQDADGEGEDLWISDGTAAGTQELFDLPDQVGSIGQKLFVSTGEFLAFRLQLDDFPSGQLWLSDGTAAGTQVVPGVLPIAVPGNFAVDGDRVWFVNGVDGLLWSTDGTLAGTAPIGGVPTGSVARVARVRNDALDGVFFDLFPQQGEGVEIWFADAGTLSAVRTGTAPDERLLRNASEAGVQPWALLDLEELGAGSLRDLGAAQPLGLELSKSGLPFAYFLPGTEVAVFSGTGDFFETLASVVRTDGTPGGTFAADVEQQILMGPLKPQLPLVVGNVLLAPLQDETLGVEPFTIPLAALETGSISVFESSCADAAQLTASGAPELGASVQLRLGDGAPGQLGVLTLSRTLLPPPAVGSCSFALLAFNQLGVFALDGTGDYATAVGVPINAALIGESVGLQAVLLELGGPLFGLLETSNAIEVVIGA